MATPSKNKRHWQQHINQWRDSGLSQAQYCQQHHLKESAFSYHKYKGAKQASLTPTKQSTFLQMPLSQVLPAQEPLTLHLANGLFILGIVLSNVALVKQLNEVLA